MTQGDGMNEIIGLRLALSIVFFLFGLYLLRCGIRVKGIVYSNENLHQSSFYETYVKVVRVFCFALPAVFTANAVCNALVFGYNNQLSNQETISVADYNAIQATIKGWYNISTVTLAASIGAVIIMLFVTTYLTSRYMPSIDSEKLSDNHPAFKKHNNKK